MNIQWKWGTRITLCFEALVLLLSWAVSFLHWEGWIFGWSAWRQVTSLLSCALAAEALISLQLCRPVQTALLWERTTVQRGLMWMCATPSYLLVCVGLWKCDIDTEKNYLSFSKDDVEKCKQKDLLEQMMAEMIGEFPDLHRTIVSERDIYLTYMLKQAAKQIELPRASESNCFKADNITSNVVFVCYYKFQLFLGNLWCSVGLSETDAACHRSWHCSKS